MTRYQILILQELNNASLTRFFISYMVLLLVKELLYQSIAQRSNNGEFI
jgi:hypothetical protein